MSEQNPSANVPEQGPAEPLGGTRMPRMAGVPRHELRGI